MLAAQHGGILAAAVACRKTSKAWPLRLRGRCQHGLLQQGVVAALIPAAAARVAAALVFVLGRVPAILHSLWQHLQSRPRDETWSWHV